MVCTYISHGDTTTLTGMELAMQRAASLIMHMEIQKGRQIKKDSITEPNKKPNKKKKKKKTPKEVEVSAHGVFDLVKMNRIVEDIMTPPDAPGNTLPDGIWEEWVFRSNPNEPPNAKSLLNRCQLLGLLICRYRAARYPPHTKCVGLHPARLIIVNKSPSDMTLRELRDSMSNLMLQWGPDIHTQPTMGTMAQLLIFLDGCLHRLGELAWATWPCGTESPISDDVGSIERICMPNGVDHDQITLTCLRTLINTFMMGYRLLHWIHMAAGELEESDETDVDQLPECTPIHHHHVSASIDVFYSISMYYDLPPAARLNYRHMFSGLYNCISQPVYYHNPDYQRKIQLDIKQITEAKVDICTLPIMLQMYPEVTILYDDDDLVDSLPQSLSALKSTEKVYAWRWLLCASRVYLFRWDPVTKEQKVYREPDGNILHCMRRNYMPHRNKYLAGAAKLMGASILSSR